MIHQGLGVPRKGILSKRLGVTGFEKLVCMKLTYCLLLLEILLVSGKCENCFVDVISNSNITTK